MTFLPLPPSPASAIPLLAGLGAIAALACFFLPGRSLGKSLPGLAGWSTSFAASFVFLFYLTIACDSAGVGLTRAVVMCTALGSVLWFLLRVGLPARPPLPKLTRGHWFMVLPALLGLSVVIQLVASPLSHWDNFFRWNHLALLIEANGALAHYPPVTDADFAVYPWADGIPPGVAVLNAWLYLAAGSIHPQLLIGRALVELGLIFSLVWHLARLFWGPSGARFSLGVLASSALFSGALALNQESGLSTVFVLLLAALLRAYEQDPQAKTAAWVGLAAGACALVRDYNLLYLPVTVGLLMAARAPRQHIFVAVGVAALVAAPWYVRNAWLTGNPLFPHSLGGLLPGNAMHDAVMRATTILSLKNFAGASWISSSLAYALAIFVGAGVALLLGAAVWMRDWRECRVLWVLAAATSLLWLLALPMTAGGWVYGARVLAPAVALAAVAAGAWVRFQTRRVAVVGVFFLGCAVVDATWRAPRYFISPLGTPFSPRPGLTQTELLAQEMEVQKQFFRALVSIAGEEGILADQPNHGVIGGSQGGKMVTLFSPAAKSLAPTAPPHATPGEVAAGLRRNGVRFCVFTLASLEMLRQIPNVAVLLSAPASVDLGPLIIYDCALLAGERPAYVLHTGFVSPGR